MSATQTHKIEIIKAATSKINDVDFADIVDAFNEPVKVLIAGEGQSGKTACQIC
jgi:D-arabinose 5-phosphate isomerase GutQ